MSPWVLVLLFSAYSAADCPAGSIYESYFNKCYQYYPTPMSFLDAEQQCNSIGGHLTDVQNAFENSYIAGIASGATSKTPTFWIGANLLRSSYWSWTSKASMSSYSNWALGQPQDANPCAYVKDSDLTWISSPCNIELSFICATSANVTTAPGYCSTPAPSSNCQPTGCPSDAFCTNGYTLYSGNCLCYKEIASFSNASANCTADGGMLAKVSSQDVNDFLTVLPGFDCSGLSCPFIGLSCSYISISSCLWIDGTPLGNYTNFLNNYPIEATSYALTTYVNGRPGVWEASWLHNNFGVTDYCQSKTKSIDKQLRHVKPYLLRH